MTDASSATSDARRVTAEADTVPYDDSLSLVRALPARGVADSRFFFDTVPLLPKLVKRAAPTSTSVSTAEHRDIAVITGSKPLPGDEMVQSMLDDIGLNDTIDGSTGSDMLYGTSGADTINAREGADRVFGGDGDDILYGNQDNDVVYGEAGSDHLYGGQGDDALYGGDGNDYIEGGLGNDLIDGEAGLDTVSYAIVATAVAVDLRAGTATGGGGTDTLANIQNVVGSVFADTLIGNAENNVFYGGFGSDVLSGGEGNDTFDGGTGGEGLYFNTSNRPDIVKGRTLFNGTMASAVVLNTYTNGNFDLIPSAYIASSTIIPHATINATASGGVFEYYAITVLAGGRALLDIDNNSFNSVIQIVTASGTVLAENDDSSDLGGTATASFLDYTFATAGTYFLRVLDHDNPTGPLAGSTYTLNVSNNQAFVTFGGGDSYRTLPDIIDGGAGIDTAGYESAPASVSVSLEQQGGVPTTRSVGGSDILISIENLLGSNFDDVLIGDAGVNVLSGGAGNDQLRGRAGNDILHGGLGLDTLYGETGDDLLFGNEGDDNLSGEAGNDQLFGGQGNDSLYGNQDIDLLYGESGTDYLFGGEGDDALYGGDGNDYLDGGLGSDRIDGEAGLNTVSYTNVSSGVTVDLRTGSATGGGGTDTLINVQNAIGSAYADTLVGNADNNVFYGGVGGDVLLGGDGDDTLDGGPVTGSQSATTIDRPDILDGGAGIDTASYESATSYVDVSLELQGSARATGGGGIDTLISIENLAGSSFGDYLTGDDGVNVLSGLNGNDELRGLSGNDILLGGVGTDSLYGDDGDDLLFGDQDNDYLTGGAGNDQLFGGQDNDVLYGDDGIDILQGGIGADVMVGGADADIFRYVLITDSLASASDSIRDFQTGVDKIDMLTLNTSPSDRVSISDAGSVTIVTFDQGGTGLNQVVIRVSGNNAVSANDLLLNSAIVTREEVFNDAAVSGTVALGHEAAMIDFAEMLSHHIASNDFAIV